MKGVSPVISIAIITFFILGAILMAYYFINNLVLLNEGEKEFKLAETSMINFARDVESVAWNLHSAQSSQFIPKYGYLQVLTNVYKFKVFVNYSSTPDEIVTDAALFRMPVRKYTRGNNYLQNLYPAASKPEPINFTTENINDPFMRVFSVEKLQYTDTIDTVTAPRVKIIKEVFKSQNRNITRIWVKIIKLKKSSYPGKPQPNYLVATCINTSAKVYSYQVNLTQLQALNLRIEIEPLNLPNDYLQFRTTPYSLNIRDFLFNEFCGGYACSACTDVEIIIDVAEVEVRVF